jgi:outer membrane receptor protein involved in Fe transport
VPNATTIPTDPPLSFPFLALGNPDLEHEKLDNFEIGWVGKVGKHLEASVALYRNELNDAIKLIPIEFYSSSNPPPGWPLPDSLLDVPPPGGFAGFPSVLQNQNVGKINQQGVEVGVSVRLGNPWTVFANYSWQDAPETEGIGAVPTPTGGFIEPLNIPPTHRLNAGVFWDIRKFYANANLNYQDEAFWADVLGPAFWGPTSSFTVVNVGVGARIYRQRMTVSVNANNLLDEYVQQHVWSDIISRKVTGQVTYHF